MVKSLKRLIFSNGGVLHSSLLQEDDDGTPHQLKIYLNGASATSQEENIWKKEAVINGSTHATSKQAFWYSRRCMCPLLFLVCLLPPPSTQLSLSDVATFLLIIFTKIIVSRWSHPCQQQPWPPSYPPIKVSSREAEATMIPTPVSLC